MPLLKLKNIHCYYGNIHAIKGVSLEVYAGEIRTLIGANGAGKSTTLMAISAILRPNVPVRAWGASAANAGANRNISVLI